MKKLTPKEEDILSYFWTNGPLFIRELLELLEEPKPHYNTLSTIVRVLEEKGYIGYRPYGNTYQYYALVSEDEYRNKTLKNLLQTIAVPLCYIINFLFCNRITVSQVNHFRKAYLFACKLL